MDEFLQSVFRSEVAIQCQFVIAADVDVWDAISNVPQKPDASLGAIWRHLQTILVSSANLYKMFWGSRGSKEKERKPLRDHFQVPDDSILRDPTLRNDFEHFDERLEAWYEKSTHRIYIGRNVGTTFVIAGAEDERRFSHYDPWMGVVSFWDNEINVHALAAEAQRLLALA